MRHKYVTRGIVLRRGAARESGLVLTLLTEDFGLVRAKAEGLRKPGAKLAGALQTLCESDVTLVRGKDGWRVTGALLAVNRFHLLSSEARAVAARASSLFLRLMPEGAQEQGFLALYRTLLVELETLPPEGHDATECKAALSLLVLLGLDAGEEMESLPRNDLVIRINKGIAASGL